MSLKKLIQLSSLFFVLSLICVGLTTYYKAGQILDSLDNVSNTQLPAVKNMTTIDMYHDGLRGIVFNALWALNKKDEKLLKDLSTEIQEMSKNVVEQLESLNKLNLHSATKKEIEISEPLLEAYVAEANEIVRFTLESDAKAADSKLPIFLEKFEALEKQLGILSGLIEKDASQIDKEGKNIQVIIGILVGLSVLVGLAIAIFIQATVNKLMGHVTRDIDATSSNVEVTSSTLQNISKEFSTGAIETAASLEETVASLQNISTLVRTNLEFSEKAYQVAKISQETAISGSLEMERLSSAMQQIQESSRKIEEILNVIDDISFQTNLLALNAAVEAARAGEHGRGFAVVADAVRSLAQRSASAAKDISHLIRDSSERVKLGHETLVSNQEVFKKVVNSISETANLSMDIVNSSKEQNESIDQIRKAMEQLDQTSQNHAAISQQVAEHSQKLSKDSDLLSTTVTNMHNQILGNRRAA